MYVVFHSYLFVYISSSSLQESMNLRRLEQKMHLEAEQKMRDDIALENSRRALQFSNQAEAMSKIRNARYTE